MTLKIITYHYNFHIALQQHYNYFSFRGKITMVTNMQIISTYQSIIYVI